MNLESNIYNFRFKLLYYFYEAVFFNKNLEDKVVESFKRRYDVPYEEFIVNNIDYLLKCGYLSGQENMINITPKGIKFIESITDGDIYFDSENMSQDTLNLIRRKFREQDIFE